VTGGTQITYGGVPGVLRNPTINTPTTYSDYITAVSTGNLIFNPVTTARFVITAISIKPVTIGTTTNYGNMYLAGRLLNPSGGDVGFEIGPDGRARLGSSLTVGTSLSVGTALSVNTTIANSSTITTFRSGLTTTSTDGYILTNATASLVGTPVQMSPRLRLSGTVWDTGTTSSKTVNFKNEVLPISGNPGSGRLLWGYDYNGGGYTELMGLTSGGNLGLGIAAATAQLHLVKADSSALTDFLINPTAKTSGNLLDLQVNTSSKFSVDYAGKTKVTELQVTNTSNGIYQGATTGILRAFGGSIGDGGGIVLGGSTHATIPNIGLLRVGGTEVVRWQIGALTYADATNFSLGTTTGTKIGTATTQKLAFWNATPVVQPVNTTAIDTLLVDTGLRATGGVSNFATTITPRTGSATAGTAPLKFTSGTLLGTPEAGAVEYSNDKFYITSVGTQKVIDRSSDVKVDTTTVTNTTTETTVFTGLVPANALKAGNILKLNMFGTIDEAAASDAVTIRVKVGSSTFATVVSPASGVADKCWHVAGVAILRTVGATGSMSWHIDMNADTGVTEACDVSTIDTTTAENITVTAQWNAAKASNVFTCTGGFMEYKN